MRLRSIKIQGFKSFADAIDIELSGACMGVVGPNGCGKSNIMDALRWVLGESRAAELRGENMQDVLFNGSGQRKPAFKATVELIFINDMGRIQGQWASFHEISVKRSLDRDGNSGYYINQQQVRRRDVHDLFMGTGLGPRAYAIIGQGMINRIIESRPEDMRLFLEEAAGISKYKERRKETINRLEDAQENCIRLQDILQELQQQTITLAEQASVAKSYKQIYQHLHTQHYYLADLQMVLAELQQQFFHKNFEETKLEIINNDHALLRLGDELNTLLQNDLRPYIEQQQAQLQALEYQLVNDQAQYHYQQQRQTEWQESQEQLQKHLHELQEKITRLDDELLEFQAQYEQVQEQLFELDDDLNANIINENKNQNQNQDIIDLPQSLLIEKKQLEQQQQQFNEALQKQKTAAQKIKWLDDKQQQKSQQITNLIEQAMQQINIENAANASVSGGSGSSGSSKLQDLSQQINQAIEQEAATQQNLKDLEENLLLKNAQLQEKQTAIHMRQSQLLAHQSSVDSLQHTRLEQENILENLKTEQQSSGQQIAILQHEQQTIEKTVRRIQKIETQMRSGAPEDDTKKVQNQDLNQILQLPNIDEAVFAQGFSDDFFELFDLYIEPLQQITGQKVQTDKLFIAYQIQKLIEVFNKDLDNLENIVDSSIKSLVFQLFIAIEQILQQNVLQLSEKYFHILQINDSSNLSNSSALNIRDDFQQFLMFCSDARLALNLKNLYFKNINLAEVFLFFIQHKIIDVPEKTFAYFIFYYLRFFIYQTEDLNNLKTSTFLKNLKLDLNLDFKLNINDLVYINQTFLINVQGLQTRALQFSFLNLSKNARIESLEKQQALEHMQAHFQQQTQALKQKIQQQQQTMLAKQQNFAEQEIFLKELDAQLAHKKNIFAHEEQKIFDDEQLFKQLNNDIAKILQEQQSNLQLQNVCQQQLKTLQDVYQTQAQQAKSQNQQLIQHLEQELQTIKDEQETANIELEEFAIEAYAQEELLHNLQDTFDILQKKVDELMQKQQKQQGLLQQYQLQEKNLAYQIQGHQQQLSEQKRQHQQFLIQQQAPKKINEIELIDRAIEIEALVQTVALLNTKLQEKIQQQKLQQETQINLQQQKEQAQQNMQNLYQKQHQNELVLQQQIQQQQSFQAQKEQALEALLEKNYPAPVPQDLAWLNVDSNSSNIYHPSNTSNISESSDLLNKNIEKNIEESIEEKSKQLQKDYKREIEHSKKALHELGDVNLQAIDAFEQAQKRLIELQTNYDDVMQAIELLQASILDIDQESRNMLQTTFEQANQLFGELFPELFGGGQAALTIQGDDLLHAGIVISAQPPGKKNSSIHLLSGGEKALTAIALIFAIFKLNPAPFCLLDEVDAPLDDSNTERYAKLIKKMSEYTQFLFISHNPIAIEIADYLIGVTMQEKGISRIVAVNIQQAILEMQS